MLLYQWSYICTIRDLYHKLQAFRPMQFEGIFEYHERCNSILIAWGFIPAIYNYYMSERSIMPISTVMEIKSKWAFCWLSANRIEISPFLSQIKEKLKGNLGIETIKVKSSLDSNQELETLILPSTQVKHSC